LYCPASNVLDPDYINIGKKDIINKREHKEITIAPFGKIHDYVSFYFGPKSPMLYSIFKGKSDTTCSQSDIVYLVTSIPKLIESKLPFVFTTGQAIMELSSQHNDIAELSKIDWDIIFAKYWFDRPPEYTDRARRRMAELLVHKHVPLDSILGIGTMNAEIKAEVEQMVEEAGVPMQVRELRNWYY
jgi:hypothetical protein